MCGSGDATERHACSHTLTPAFSASAAGMDSKASANALIEYWSKPERIKCVSSRTKLFITTTTTTTTKTKKKEKTPGQEEQLTLSGLGESGKLRGNLDFGGSGSGYEALVLSQRLVCVDTIINSSLNVVKRVVCVAVS